jgi:two-component system, chemotaxis family, chemotaxis protein CheV
MNDTTRFVTFPLGEGHYALDSCQVKELAMPSRVYKFPHTMPSLQGVLVRRGTVIPVCDLRGAFGNGAEPSFYVVAQCNYAGRTETVAIPVSGNCELVQGERGEAPGEVTFVAGLLRTGGRTVPLLDLDQVVAHCIQPANVLAAEKKR